MLWKMNYLELLKLNPSNPRQISERDYAELKKSIQEFSEMLEIREIIYDSDYVIWGGNMRFQAYKWAVEQGLLKYDDKYFRQLPAHWTLAQKRRFAITDNVNRGGWDDDILANEWDDLPLEEWGINTGNWEDKKDKDDLILKDTFEVIVECKNEQEQKESYENLIAEGYECRLLTL